MDRSCLKIKCLSCGSLYSIRPSSNYDKMQIKSKLAHVCMVCNILTPFVEVDEV